MNRKNTIWYLLCSRWCLSLSLGYYWRGGFSNAEYLKV